MISRSQRHSQQHTRLVGVQNTGNTCYLASVFQILFNLVNFRNLIFLCLLHTQDSRAIAQSKPITLGVSIVFNELLCSSSSTIDLVAFKRLVQDNRFSGQQQQDAHEFLMYLLNGLINENAQYADRFRDMFQITFEEVLTCTICNTSRTNPALSLEYGINLSTIDESTLSQLLIDDSNELLDRVNCEVCKVNQPTSKKLVMTRAPPVLIFHLRRFLFNGLRSSKINSIVSFDELEVIRTRSGNVTYDLQSFIVHRGEEAISGHYIAIVKLEQSFFLLDDAIVHQTDFQPTQVDGQPYLLVYSQPDIEIQSDYDLNQLNSVLLRYQRLCFILIILIILIYFS